MQKESFGYQLSELLAARLAKFSVSLPTCWGQLRQEITDVNEVIVEDPLRVVQQAEDCRIRYRVEDVLSLLAALQRCCSCAAQRVAGTSVLCSTSSRALKSFTPTSP